MHQILRLDGQHSCALIEFEAGCIPVWRHYGARIGQTALLQAWRSNAMLRLPNAAMDRMEGVPLLPCFGNGLSRNPALIAHRDGLGGIQELVCRGFEQSANAQIQTLVLRLSDDSTQAGAALEAVVTLTLHVASDMLSIATVLRNSGNASLQVARLAAGVIPVAAHLREVGSLSGVWANEFQWQRIPVPQAGWQMQNRHGRSSHEASPACFMLAPHSDEHGGEVIAAHLGWSGSHYFMLDHDELGGMLLQAGEWFAPGEVRLAPGACVTTPPLHVTWSDCGTNGVAHNFHQFARREILKWPGTAGGASNDAATGAAPMSARPVHLNTWEAVYFAHDDAVLRELACRGAAIGVERFVLDDGWFPGRPNDASGLGDWWPDPAKYPNGLGPLISHVHGLGMAFGLWVEPEMVNPDSELFRKHPDWALQTQGRSLQTGRYQLVLDISRQEVSDYLFEKLDTVLTENAISYLKWDMNRDLAQAQDQAGRMACRAQVPALYALLERLHVAHPNVEIESCASGGGRIDLGILRHTQRFWTSDNNDAVSRVKIQSGAARLFPLEVLGAHVGPAPAHCTGRAQSMAFRCAVACFGHMGVEADLRKLDPDETETLARWIALHKAWRGVLHSGKFEQGTTANGVWWLIRTPGKCLLGVFTLTPPASPHHAPVRLPGLPGKAVWQVRLLAQAGLERARAEAPAAWLQALQAPGVAVSAAELRHIGLPIPNMHPESALVFSLETDTP